MSAERTEPVEVERKQVRSEALPLGARPSRDHRGWSITLPVRAETVDVVRATVAVEEVVVRTHFVEEPATVHGLTRRRETLEVDGEARAAVT